MHRLVKRQQLLHEYVHLQMKIWYNLAECIPRFFWDSYHLLKDIWPMRLEGLWTHQFLTGIKKLLYAESSEDFDICFEEKMRTFGEKERILDGLREISTSQNHFANILF